MNSIRNHVLVWLLSSLSLGAALLILASYVSTLEEMNEVFDDELKQVALTVLTHHQDGTRVDSSSKKPMGSSEEFAFVTQIWTVDGQRLFTSVSGFDIPFTQKEGLQTVPTLDGEWRVYTANSGSTVFQAAQPMEARQNLAQEVAFKLLIPVMIIVPVIALLLTLALRKGLRPLARASNDVERKSAFSLEPIPDATLPRELRPLVVSINSLMARLANALSAQRQFTADAAHELRTPLTALRLQLQLVEQAHDQGARSEAMADIKRGLDRATHLVEQLLDLSRLEPDAAEYVAQPIDLVDLVKAAVSDFSVKADAKHIDLGVEIEAGAENALMIKGDANQLRILLNNLVENALRFTAAAGKIDVVLRRDARSKTGILEVLDSGPGIPAEERVRVFDRFYRASTSQSAEGVIPGSGLGLAIVKKIADRHGISIELADGLKGQYGCTGLTVRLKFFGQA
ncbi:MAG: two-component sensor histidine kinase [Burkholderiales bacterium]|nr:two-component sensor histidine kinase [Burkholderiales bacterium]